jgi:hypothetical protein
MDVASKKYGTIDKTFVWAISPTFEFVGEFSEGLAKAKKDGKYGFINYL